MATDTDRTADDRPKTAKRLKKADAPTDDGPWRGTTDRIDVIVFMAFALVTVVAIPTPAVRRVTVVAAGVAAFATVADRVRGGP